MSLRLWLSVVLVWAAVPRAAAWDSAATAPRRADTILARLQQAVIGYVDGAARLVDKATGALSDPHETMYPEGYGPACLAVVAASAYRWTGRAEYQSLALRMVYRSLERVRDPHPDDSTFTALFLAYYSLLAYDELSPSLPPAVRADLAEALRTLDHGHRPRNTNGLAMALCYDVNLYLMGLAELDPNQAWERLAQIEEAVGELGFINDAVARDAHPIAYHLYVASLLSDSIWLAGRAPPGHQEAREIIGRMKVVRDRAAVWCDRFIAADGSFTMAERSRDQFWTCGAFVFLQAVRGRAAEEHLAWWLRFAKPDGTISVTPNHFPNTFRVGFESYSNVVMYNGLGFCYLARAARALEGGGATPLPPPGDSLFWDREAGWLHVVREGSSLGLALRRHGDSFAGGYAAALSPINLSLGGSSRRPLANPSYRSEGAEVEVVARRRLAPERGVYEGVLARSAGRWWGPDWTTNAEVTADASALVFQQEEGPVRVVKSLVLDRRKLRVEYRVTAVEAIEEMWLQFPLLISDGREDTHYRIVGGRVHIGLGDERYTLSLHAAEGAWDLSPVVYLTSTSGAVRQLCVQVGSRIAAGETVAFGWELARE